MESPETRTLPEKKTSVAVKKEGPEISQDKAREAIEKLRQEQEKRETDAQRQEHLKKLQEQRRLEALRNRLAAEGASEAESQIPEGARNDILNDYKNDIVPRIKENWVFPDVGMGTRTEVSITVFADGTIRINRIISPSGNRAFDQSVLKAIVKTGRVAPPPFGRNEDVTLNFIPVNK
jgi:colicin import membrane protein